MAGYHGNELVMKRVLILGVNGFIGHHLSQAIIRSTDWEVYGMDMQADRIADLLERAALPLLRRRHHDQPRVDRVPRQEVRRGAAAGGHRHARHLRARAAARVRARLRGQPADRARRACATGKRIVFPSTSEVYGMCARRRVRPGDLRARARPHQQAALDLRLREAADGPRDPRLRQQEGLDYTLFRPFNWIGAGLDSINTPKEGSSRVITQFLGHIVRGEPIKLVDGGTQKRAFTYIDDGIDALMKIIANQDGVATGKIYNIGNPANNWSVRELAADDARARRGTIPNTRDSAPRCTIVETTARDYYGSGYQDVQNRVPKIDNTCATSTGSPVVGMDDALRRIFDAYRGQVAEARGLVD